MKAKKNVLLLIAIIVCAASVAAMTVSLGVISKREKTFVPPAFDENAVAGVPDVPEEIQWGEVDAQVYKASLCGVLHVVDGRVDIWLTNPEDNQVWLKLRVLDAEGNILGETGLLRPGEYVKSVALTTVPQTGQSVTLKLMAYEPDTYYSAGSVLLNAYIEDGDI